MTLKRAVYRLLSTPCCECKEVRVWFWTRRCQFCDVGEGEMK